MGVRLGAALLAIAAFSAAPARAEESLACEREMTRAAALNGVPLNVLYSVGLTETGRKGELSPYDMNIDGKDVHSATLAEAMASFAGAKAQGAKLIIGMAPALLRSARCSIPNAMSNMPRDS
jgi:hypothetical protein